MMSGKVMAHYDPNRDTRLYVDEGPAGVAGTVAQKYKLEGMDHPLIQCGDQSITQAELKLQQR